MTDHGTVSLFVRPHGWPVVNAYFGGRHAAELARTGRHALIAETIRHLAHLAGRTESEVNADLDSASASCWTIDPFVQGAYSYARPGYSDARGRLAEPFGRALYFAGEATSRDAFSTAHGAYASGQRAAAEFLHDHP